MDIEPPLPYLNPQIMTGQNLMMGANFASAGIGILNDTGLQYVRPAVPLIYYNKCICNFPNTIKDSAVIAAAKYNKNPPAVSVISILPNVANC